MSKDFSQNAVDDLFTVCRTHGMHPKDIELLLRSEPRVIFERLIFLGKPKKTVERKRLNVKVVSNNIPDFLK